MTLGRPAPMLVEHPVPCPQGGISPSGSGRAWSDSVSVVSGLVRAAGRGRGCAGPWRPSAPAARVLAGSFSTVIAPGPAAARYGSRRYGCAPRQTR
jgi:hypothetical protein